MMCQIWNRTAKEIGDSSYEKQAVWLGCIMNLQPQGLIRFV